MHLASDAAKVVLEEYGAERMSYVLANTVRHFSWDNRFSVENRKWAESIPVFEDQDPWGEERNVDFVVNSHPAVLDGFINLLREELKVRETISDRIKAEVTTGEPVQTLTFYVAECMEFPVLGEYHDNLTLQEAVELYEKIPSERMNGVKGIGFFLYYGSMYDGEYELMSGDKISKDLIDLVPYYKDHPLVQGAISDLEEILSQKQQMAEKEVVSEISQEQPIKQEKTPEKAPEKDSSTSKGTGKKESVLKALRERRARLMEQNQDKDEQKSKGHKKGEQEL